MKTNRIFLLICCCLLTWGTFAQSFQKFSDLANDWQVFDESDEVYVPYVESLHYPVRKAHLVLNRQENSYWLHLKKNEGFLFINNRLCHDFGVKPHLFLDLDSLFRLDTAQNFLVSYYSKQIIEKFPEVHKGRFMNLPTMPTKNITTETSLARLLPKQTFRDYLILASLSLLLLIALISKFSKSSVLSLDRESERLSRIGQAKKIQFNQFILFTLLYAVSIGFTFLFLSVYTSVFSLENVTLLKKDFWGLHFGFLKVVFFVALFLCMKYCLIWLIGYLFNNRFIANFHFQEYLNISQMFCIIWGLAMILLNAVAPRISAHSLEIWVYIFGVAWLVKSLIVSFRMNRAGTYQKLHLFSYLCTTEYVPALLLAKIFLKSYVKM